MDYKDLNVFCAPGTTVEESRVPISEWVDLRLVTFTPDRQDCRPPVLFVAGWVSLIEGWTEVLKEMTKDHPVYYIETREKISSVTRSRVKFNVNAIGEDIVQLTEILRLKNNGYVLFGSSLGATVILDCFPHLKRRPLCLILIAPNAEFRIPLFWKGVIHAFYPQFYFILKPVIKWYLKKFRLNVQSDHAQYEKYCRALDAADPEKLKKAAIAFSKYQVWDKLQYVEAPTLILGGSKDKLHEPDSLKRMINLIPKAEYADLETNRRTHTAEAVQVMDRFIDKLPETGPD
jgi:pimeloyl-ACP methyl ester carboxylesterase